jgi:hypothetical protein
MQSRTCARTRGAVQWNTGCNTPYRVGERDPGIHTALKTGPLLSKGF